MSVGENTPYFRFTILLFHINNNTYEHGQETFLREKKVKKKKKKKKKKLEKLDTNESIKDEII
ncbi:MAG: hypothetical protein JSY10_30265 [Paenibacillus sp.]|nr:hypothetical protein [Paenibacillus sp.]